MKKFLAIFAVIIFAFGVATAQTTATHIVDKGETLASIAKKYGVSEAEIISLNPEAAQFIYVGQELAIPQASRTAVQATANDSGKATGQSATDALVSSENNSDESDDKPGFFPNFSMEYGFLSKEKGVKGTNYTYAFTLGANYFFMRKLSGLFAGVNIGYNSANYNNHASAGRGQYVSETTTAHFVTLPIHVGYRFAASNRNFGITPYAGLDVNFCVGGKTKTKGRVEGVNIDSETKFNKKTGIDARVGLKFSIGLFNVGAAYVFPVNDNQKAYFGKDAYLAISIGGGF